MDLCCEKEITESLHYLTETKEKPYRLTGLDHSAADIINEALVKYKNIEITYTETLYLSKPIVMPSGSRLRMHKNTVIKMEAGCGGCMLRNANIQNGMDHTVQAEHDTDILVEGGIWDGASRSLNPHDENETFQVFREKNIILGVIFFSNASDFIIRDLTVRQSEQYAVLLAGCKRFIVEDLVFDDHKKDGVHINGPSSYGIVRRLSGKTGDDFVALNAWDWCTSAVSFGSIHDIAVKDLNCVHDEIRLLPGRKTYSDGRKTECEVYNCSFENLSGVFYVKMYQQPNCHNKEFGILDRSEIAGNMKNIRFSGLTLDRIGETGVGEVHVTALFEICTDCENLSITDVNIGQTEEDYLKSGMHLTDTGPKSSTWKRGRRDPESWCELFNPDLICRVRDIIFKNIRFAGKGCANIETLAYAHRLFPNSDYPNTTPAGGTGYGIIENAIFYD